jgi:hypothetical protein
LNSQIEGVAAATADTLFYLIASENDVWDRLEIQVRRCTVTRSVRIGT